MKVFDAHGDILTEVKDKHELNIDIFNKYHKELYEKGDVLGSVFINYTDPNSEEQEAEFEKINEISLPYFKNDSYFHIVENKIDYDKFNVIFGIEGLNVVKDLTHVDRLYDLGYRLFGLTWNENNKFAHSHLSNDKGLTDLGIKLVKHANEKGLIIDLAHASKQTVLDTAKYSTNPLLISHTGIQKYNNISRNIDDEILELVKASNGVVGIYAINKFLDSESNSTIDTFIKHLDYVVKKIGIDHVCLGLDFCYYLGTETGSGVTDLQTIADVQNIKDKLLQLNYNEKDISKIFSENFLRVINEILSIK